MRWLRNLFKRALIKKPYSTRKIERRLKRFANKKPRSENEATTMLAVFPVWYEAGIMRDMAVETLILLWNQYYKNLSMSKQKDKVCSIRLAYQRAITIYVQRVLAAKRAGKEKS